MHLFLPIYYISIYADISISISLPYRYQPPFYQPFASYWSLLIGPSKGAMNTHYNIVFNSHIVKDWMKLDRQSDIQLAVAPFFHITGLIIGLTTSICAPSKRISNGTRASSSSSSLDPLLFLSYILIFLSPSSNGNDLSISSGY